MVRGRVFGFLIIVSSLSLLSVDSHGQTRGNLPSEQREREGEAPTPRSGVEGATQAPIIETQAQQPYKADLEYKSSVFDSISTWHEVSAALSRKMKLGTLIGRLNYANRFDQSGVQFEVDGYPKFGRKVYAYLNFGYSPSNIFSEFRYGGELYWNLPEGFEISGGARRLEFTTSAVNIYTAALGKYLGNYWISLRPYLTPRPTGLNWSMNGSLRRYFSSADHYLGVSTGYGFSATQIGTTSDLDRTESFKVQLEGNIPIKKRPILTWSLGYDREGLPRGVDRDRFSIGIGTEVPF